MIAQLLEHCTSITDIMGSIPIQAWIFFRFFYNSLVAWITPRIFSSIYNAYTCFIYIYIVVCYVIPYKMCYWSSVLSPLSSHCCMIVVAWVFSHSFPFVYFLTCSTEGGSQRGQSQPRDVWLIIMTCTQSLQYKATLGIKPKLTAFLYFAVDFVQFMFSCLEVLTAQTSKCSVIK